MNKQSILNESKDSLRTGMFNLSDGRNVMKLDETDRFNVRSVIAYVDEERNVALGLCPVKIMLPFAFGCLAVCTEDILDGREATRILLEEAAKEGIELPAAEFCVNYDRFGVGKGEAFLPSFHDLKKFSMQGEVGKAWRRLGLEYNGTIWSSTIGINFNAWMQSYDTATVTGWHIQYRTFGVIPVIEIPL